MWVSVGWMAATFRYPSFRVILFVLFKPPAVVLLGELVLVLLVVEEEEGDDGQGTLQ